MEAKTSWKLVVLEGDGIGPEVIREALKVLRRVGELYSLTFEFEHRLVGGAAIDNEGRPVSEETLSRAAEADGVLLGAVGGEKWDGLSNDRRPEKGLLALRSALGLFANLRPAQVFPELAGASTLREEVVAGIDIMVVRELVSGIYFGEPRGIEQTSAGMVGFNTMKYTADEVERVSRLAFDLARQRRSKVTSVDKANVLEVSRLWRDVVTQVGTEFPDVELDHQYVDNCAMQLVRNPRQFDVLLTGNMFGDILSDEAAMITGSLGMLPSASIGGSVAMYEPVHGSAPDITGQDKANPLATILSVAMMLDTTCHQPEAAEAVRRAVAQTLAQGWRTADIAQDGCRTAGCRQMGDLVVEQVAASAEQSQASDGTTGGGGQ